VSDLEPFSAEGPVPVTKEDIRKANPAERLRRSTLRIVGASVIIAALLAVPSGMRIDFVEASPKFAVFAGVLFGSVSLKSKWGGTLVGDCLGSQAVVWLSGIACGFITLIGLHLHFPRVDQLLMASDRAIGLDGVAFSSLVAKTPRAAHGVIVIAYKLTVPLVLLSMLVQALLKRPVEAWRAAFCFAGSLITVSLISIVTPAKGVGLWLSDATLAQLPGASARYFWGTFDRFYDGTDLVLRTTSIDGIVSFPSFHMVMGLIIVMLWRKNPVTLALALAWFIPMLVGTVPLGGHYFVDLIGGLVIWAGWFCLSYRGTGKVAP
jgi:membrane-associated phospholipid phosphatase